MTVDDVAWCQCHRCKRWVFGMAMRRYEMSDLMDAVQRSRHLKQMNLRGFVEGRIGGDPYCDNGCFKFMRNRLKGLTVQTHEEEAARE